MDREFLNIRSLVEHQKITISPNSKYIAYVVQKPEKYECNLLPRYTPPIFIGVNIYITDIDTGETTILMDNLCRTWGPSWSVDSKKLSYYADQDGYVKLYLWDVKTKNYSKISDIPARGYGNHMDFPRWLNNEIICIPLLPEKDFFRGYSNDSQKKVINKEIGNNRCTAQEIFWRQRGDRIFENDTNNKDPYYLYRSDIGLINIKTNEVRRIITNFKAKMVYPSPDGKRLAISTFGERPNINKWSFSEDIYFFDLERSLKPILVTSGLETGGNPRHNPQWSPNSDKIAFIKNNCINIWSVLNGYTHTVTNLPPLINSSYLQYSKDGDSLLIICDNDLYNIKNNEDVIRLKIPKDKVIKGIINSIDNNESKYGYFVITIDKTTKENGIYCIFTDGFEPQCLFEEPVTLLGTSFNNSSSIADISQDGNRFIYALENVNRPAELWVADKKFVNRRQVSNINPNINIKNDIRSEILKWKDGFGTERKGILLSIPDNDSGKFPLVVSIYPNHVNSKRAFNWDFETASAILPPQLLLAYGFAVFIPDIFLEKGMILKSIGEDIMAAINAVINTGKINKDKMSVMGHSFGGYAVNCIITQTNIFKAAISSAGCGNLSSIYGAYDINEGMIDGYGCQWVETGQIGIGAPWENPKGYMENSPLFYLDKVETPLLLIGGSNDPAYQPSEMLVGLERLDKEVKCITYTGEGHTPRDWNLENRIDVAERIIKFIKYNFAK